MENTNILDLDYSVFKQIQNILDSPGSMESFLEVLPPECSSEDVLLSMELESKKYGMTPAKVLLTFLGSKGFGILNLIQWFQVIRLEKALMFLKADEPLRIITQPVKNLVVNEGGEIILTCVAVSYPPPEFQWYKDDVELLLQVDSTLTINSASETDSGNYTCFVSKWNRKTNGIEYLNSDSSAVQVVPSPLRVTSSQYQELQSSVLNCVRNLQLLPKKRYSSLEMSDLGDSGISSLTKENSAVSSKGYEVPCVQSSKKEIISIDKQPYVYGKVSQGMSLYLTFEVSSTSQTVNYQWIKDAKPLAGETSFHLILQNLYPDPDTGQKKWKYQCVAFNEHDEVHSEVVTVELDDVNETTPFMAQQKYAFLVANDEYEHLESLKKPAADVKDLATILSSMGFKILALRNLTLVEMRNALDLFCNSLVPGSYALFFFAGHGFDSCGQTYLQPVDSSNRQLHEESMCLEFVLECFQKKKPAINILLVDACRKLSPSGSSHGKIFDARMKNNTIYGYSTSFLCSSHECDEEANSMYVKYLKKYISQDKSIQDILLAVNGEFAKDPLVKNVQYPGIKTTLYEKRKFSDPVRESSTPNALTDIINWCDIKNAQRFYEVELDKNSTIAVEFDHHMGTFCNGKDISVFLKLKPGANLSNFQELQIGLNPPLPEICVHLRNVLPGKCNFLFRREILNIQKLNNPYLKGVLFLKPSSGDFRRNYEFMMDLSKFVQLKLSINDLKSNTIEDYSNHTVNENSLT